MAKYVLTSEKTIGTLSYTGDKTESEVLAMMQANEPEYNWATCTKVPRGKHICKYCGNIAEGTHSDFLCKDCRDTFGHTLFSEL